MGEHSGSVTEAEVAAPPNEVGRELFDELRQAHAERPASQLPDAHLEPGERLRRNLPLATVVRDAETQELALLGPSHGALGHVDLQPQSSGQEVADAAHDAVAGAMAANVDVAVIGIATESMAAPFQFLVQFVEHQIAQQWGERAALRSALLGRTDQPIFHHPGAKECPDELEHALVGHPFGHASHQAVLIDSVEKFLEVDVNHHVVAVGDVLLCLGHGLMSGASRTESVAVLGKRRVPLLLEYLQQRLLDQAIDDAWHAEPSDAAGRFRDVDPFDRLRCVGSREQLCPDGRPVLPQVGRGVVDGQSVDASCTWRSAIFSTRSSSVRTKPTGSSHNA